MQEVKIVGAFDETTGELTFPAQMFTLTGDETGETPTDVPPVEDFMLHLTGTDDVVLMCKARPGEKYKVWRDAPNDDGVIYQVIGETNSGEYRDNTPTRTDTSQVYAYTMTAVRLSDGWESMPVPAQHIVIPALPETPPDPEVPPPIDPTNPKPPSGGPIEILELRVGVSSVVVRIKPFPGAVDHWIYPVGNSRDRKCFGKGGDIGEWNGTIEGNALVVEALDKEGPYMAHVPSHHSMPMPGLNVINGQGPASNVPKVLAKSVNIPVRYKAKPTLPAGAAYLHYDDPVTLTRADDGDTKATWEQSDGKARFFANAVNVPWSDVFVSKSHVMLDVSDGPSTTYPGDVPLHAVKHQSNAAICMDIAGEWDISGGKYLRVYSEWDARLDEKMRRWVKIIVYPAADQLMWLPNIDEAFLGHENIRHTERNEFFVWRIDGQANTALRVRGAGNGQPTPKRVEELTRWSWNRGGADRGGPADRNRVYKDGRTLNGTSDATIDLRHGFELFLSETRAVAYEYDGLGYGVKVYDLQINLGLGNRLRVAESFHAYHLLLGRDELKGSNFLHWQNNTPYSHMFHGDNIIVQVVDSVR